MSKPISRSSFLKAATGIVCFGGVSRLLSACTPASLPPHTVLGPSMKVGHAIRDGQYNADNLKPSKHTQTKVTIVGGGISGLSCAWWLKKNGIDDFALVELEKDVGGNSAFGQNSVSAFPWGAHYVPLPNPESKYVRELFKELSIITAENPDGMASYNELYLCHDPQERLLKDGSFQEGLVPQRGLQPQDKDQFAKFFKLIKEFRAAKDADGKPAFAIPLDLSSPDEKWRKLDRISMKDWLVSNGFDSNPLLWYVNYCCRDDYGAPVERVSAWAGIHYFAGRRGVASNSEPNAVLTWPEGNGFLVKHLKDQISDRLRTGLAAMSVRKSESGVQVLAHSPQANAVEAFESSAVVVACPRFIAQRIVPQTLDQTPTYAPWLVANLTLTRMPNARGVGLAWDNVSYNSPSLGYVVATHQNIATREGKTVLTYYLPLSEEEPKPARHMLAKFQSEKWLKEIIADLESMHPGISSAIEQVDLWPWAHGMVSPAPGYIWGDTRAQMKQPYGNIFFAHSDMSGISNFEEAQYQGVEAAKRVLALLQGDKTS